MSSGISVTVKERRSIEGLSRTTLLPQFYIKRVAIPTHSVVQTKMMWKSCKLLPRRKADVNSRSNTFVQLYDNMEEPGMFPLLSRLLQPSRVFLLAMDVPGRKKKRTSSPGPEHFLAKSVSQSHSSCSSEGA